MHAGFSPNKYMQTPNSEEYLGGISKYMYNKILLAVLLINYLQVAEPPPSHIYI